MINFNVVRGMLCDLKLSLYAEMDEADEKFKQTNEESFEDLSMSLDDVVEMLDVASDAIIDAEKIYKLSYGIKEV